MQGKKVRILKKNLINLLRKPILSRKLSIKFPHNYYCLNIRLICYFFLKGNARHHWSFTDNFHDTKGHADIESSKNATLDYDRFNVNNRAVHLSNGYLNVLPGN